MEKTKNKKLVVVGGVAGGASCAARARRLSEHSEIVIFERGPFVSFANCGLPYHVGKVIDKEEDLIVASPELFRGWFNIDVRPSTQVFEINRKKKCVTVKSLSDGRSYEESYDALLISPGATPLRPRLDGIELPGIYTLRDIPDIRRIKKWIQSHERRHATVVGGGFIGLEMAENLKRLGMDVAIIEMLDHVMPSIDREMAALIHSHLTEKGVQLHLKTAVTGFSKMADERIRVSKSSGGEIATDLVILCVGVRPEISLARDAGLEIGETGAIIVNSSMQTNDPHIWAVGDAVEVRHVVSGQPCNLPLAGPANRQGRIAAESIMKREDSSSRFRGVQGTSICGIMGLSVAATGLSEKSIEKANEKNETPIAYEKIYLHPDHHAGYYPNAKMMTIKLIFSSRDGKILGAQAVGMEGVDKRMDVIAMAIQMGGTIHDLEEAELCYAPQFGSAKDPVNLAGMIAVNTLNGYSPTVHFDRFPFPDSLLLDVRTKEEYEKGHIPDAINVPLHELRSRLPQLPKDKKIYTHCMVGKRAYYAIRILRQHGFDAYNISGGFRLYKMIHPEG